MIEPRQDLFDQVYILWLSAEEMVTGLNRGRLGELYYSLGPVYQAYRAIDRHTPLRLRRCPLPYLAHSSASAAVPYDFGIERVK
jgi:hypothetical protein